MTVSSTPVAARLLSPEEAATYLGLGSRWATYRLIKAGEVPAILIAGKLRLDRVDLDELIQRLKAGQQTVARLARGHARTTHPRASLAPLARSRPSER